MRHQAASLSQNVKFHLPEFSQVDASVIIVNYNGGQDVLDCLSSLQTARLSTRLEIIVVDNNSTDGSTAQIAAQFESVKLHILNENRGFAAACNAGMTLAQADTILLLNPDTVVIDDALGKMFSALQSNPDWGIVGAQMLNTNRIPYRAARRFPCPRDMAIRAMGLAKFFPSSRSFNGYLYGEQVVHSLDEVDQIEGSCLMISEAARREVGNLDERFFIFFEEVDWCRRVKDAGLEIHVVNEAKVIHKVSTTMGRYYEFTRSIHAQSAMKYFLKHEGQSGYRAIRNAMTFALLARAIVLAVPAMLNLGGSRRRFTGTLAERRAYINGLTD